MSAPIARTTSAEDAPKPGLAARMRDEPFRLFFPFACALGVAGVLPWMLFGAGLTSRWLAGYHATTQMQGFMLAFAAGFLFTAIPKRTRSAPASWIEIAAIALLLPTISIAALASRIALAQMAYAAALVVLAQFAIRRVLGRAAGRRPPASFAAVPIGLVSGIAGAIMVVAGTSGPVLAIGRMLVLDGVFLCLVLGVGVFFFGLALRGEAAPDAPVGRAMSGYALSAAGVVASIFVEGWVSAQLGLALRAAVVVLVFVISGAFRWPTRPGFNRKLVWLSGAALPIGLVAAAVVPEQRISAMHIVYVGGFGLMGLTVAAHVALGHGGFDAEQQGSPPAIVAFGSLFVAAAIVRALAVVTPATYVVWLAVAAGLWLAGALVWAIYLVPKMWAEPRSAERAP